SLPGRTLWRQYNQRVARELKRVKAGQGVLSCGRGNIELVIEHLFCKPLRIRKLDPDRSARETLFVPRHQNDKPMRSVRTHPQIPLPLPTQVLEIGCCFIQGRERPAYCRQECIARRSQPHASPDAVEEFHL